MRTLKKADIESMERELEILKVNQQKMVRGGGIDGYCYFYCLEYLGNNYGCGYDMSYYMNNYASQYGYSELFPDEDTGQIVGVSMDHMRAYTSQVFSTFTGTGQNSNSSLLGVIDMGNNEGHAVIMTDYNSETDTYSYYDPMNDTTGTCTGSSVVETIGIDGCSGEISGEIMEDTSGIGAPE